MNKQPLRIAINGFGRIGRNVLRALFEHATVDASQYAPIQIVAINDIAPADVLMHLLRFDTTHGRFAGEVTHHGDSLQVTNHAFTQQITLLNIADPEQLPWNQLAIDVVLECTGHFRSRVDASKHLIAGAKRVIIGAAPFDSVDIAVVFGVNEHLIEPHHQVISSVSCTTQALVPLVKILDENFGIQTAMMTEIHAMTTDQSVLDHAHRDLRRARSASQNIIPTTSSALGALKQILPNMTHKITGYSIRVPTLNVAAIDLTFVTPQQLNVKQVNDVLIHAANTQYRRIMAVTDQPLVSSDFNHQPYSLVVDLLQTMVVGQQVKVFAWFDNEWGYANRMLDLCKTIASATT